METKTTSFDMAFPVAPNTLVFFETDFRKKERLSGKEKDEQAVAEKRRSAENPSNEGELATLEDTLEKRVLENVVKE